MSLSEKEKLFCRYYISTWNLKEASIKAGYKLFPERVGVRLLQKIEVKDEISKLNDQIINNPVNVQGGYERLAFGNVSDAIKLLFSSNINSLDFDLMDFFNVAEIKRLKDGAMEIKFFDRFKALEKLSEMVERENSKTPPLYKAIVESSLALNSGDNSAI